MKVKFTKLAALLLAGAALLASGCTDYEVDIQNVDKKVDALASGRVATLETQLAALHTTLQTDYETIAAHNQDMQNLRGEITTLETTLKGLIDLKLDKTTYEAFLANIADAQKTLEGLKYADKDFVHQVASLLKDLDAQVAANKENLENITKEGGLLDQTLVKAKEYTDGEISRLEGRLEKAEKAIEDLTKEGGIIDQIKADIAKKVNQSDFDAYKEATAETIRVIKANLDALNALTAGFPEDTTIKDYIDAVKAKLDDYVLTTTFEEFAKIVGTKAELEDFEGTIIGRLKSLEALAAGFPENTTIKEYIDKETKTLQGQLDKITNEEGTGRLDVLEKTAEEYTKKVDDVVAMLEFAEGDLQGYIDAAAKKAYDDAVAYVDEYMEFLIDQLNQIFDDIYNQIAVLAARIQSIVYVPDYEDLKITTNMAYVSQEVEETVEGATAGAAESAIVKKVAVIDQPTKLTYKITPAQYAWYVAAYYDELLEFDVKPLNTRADEAEAEVEYGFEILSADYDDATVDETGEVTFTVMPKNIASVQFAANGLKPNYYVDLRSGNTTVRGLYDLEGDYFQKSGYFYGGEADLATEYGFDVLHVGVWTYEDLKAYEARTAFAASLRLRDNDMNTEFWGMEFPEYNEVASTYSALYPAVTEVNILPDPYREETDEDGNTKLVPVPREYQYLPYSSLRTNPVGEKATQDPKGYRVIMDKVVPAVEVNGEVVKYEDAAKLGLLLPAVETVFDEFTYDKGTATADLDETNFVETAKVYAEIEMNPQKNAAVRKTAIGNVITGNYYFGTAIGKTPFFGQVEITPALGEVDITAEIIWTYELDADVDHNLFYPDETVSDVKTYSRKAYEVTVDATDMAYLKENLDIDITSFSHKDPASYTITYKDEEGKEVDVTDEVVINGVTISEDGKLLINISNFEWDKVYTVKADYVLDAATVTVTAVITTKDRNREPVVVNLGEHVFVVNGEEFVDGVYVWSSEPLHGPIFKAFDENEVINVKGAVLENGDFEYDAEQEDFNAAELEGKIRMAASDKTKETTAYPYVDINRADIVAKTQNLTPAVLAGLPFNDGLQRDENDPNLWHGKVVTRNITTYIGEEVEIQMIFSYKVPDYNFLHLSYYTFNTEKENGNFIQKHNFKDNDGTVKWWTQVNPSYFTGDYNAQQERISFRHALKDYDVAYINLAELAFNVVDDKDVVIEDADMEELGLSAEFIYTDKTQGEKALPKVDQIDPEFMIYKSLWVDNTTFYYRTNEKKFIPSLGTLTLTVGDGDGAYAFPVATRFEFPKAAVKYPEEVLDYSTYAMVRWTPFKEPVAEGYTMVLDENKIYRIPLFKGMYLKDNRPNGVSYDVIKDGEWVVGNVAEYDAEAGTYTTGGNGYIKDVPANVAYHINTTFTYDDLELPVDLRKLLTIVYSNDGGKTFVNELPTQDPTGATADVAAYVPYVQYDYTSEVQFRGTVTIPVVVALENPWQETINFVYDFVIKGVE